MANYRKPEPGTVIHATMREEDLLPAFATKLAFLSDESVDRTLATAACAIVGKLEQKEVPDEVREEAQYLLEQLFDRLDFIGSQFGFVFGAHEGDGSDYGFWEAED